MLNRPILLELGLHFCDFLGLVVNSIILLRYLELGLGDTLSLLSELLLLDVLQLQYLLLEGLG